MPGVSLAVVNLVASALLLTVVILVARRGRRADYGSVFMISLMAIPLTSCCMSIVAVLNSFAVASVALVCLSLGTRPR